jgi:hypothetical protein
MLSSMESNLLAATILQIAATTLAALMHNLSVHLQQLPSGYLGNLMNLGFWYTQIPDVYLCPVCITHNSQQEPCPN